MSNLRLSIPTRIGILLLLEIVTIGVLGLGIYRFNSGVSERPSSWPLVFSDSFTSDVHQWPVRKESGELASGELQITGGKYRWDTEARADGMVWPAVLNNEAFSDFYLTVEARQVSGDEDGNYGVVFRRNSQGYYLFRIRGDRQFRFSVRDEGEWATLIDWKETVAIRPGEMNKLAVLAQGADFTFFINDELVGEASDKRFDKGEVGLAIGLADVGDKAVFEFDNFELRVSPVELAQLTSTAQAARDTTDARSEWPLVLYDSFDSNRNDWPADEYDDESGNRSRLITNGKYRWDVTAMESVLWQAVPDVESVSDFHITVDVIQTSGPEDSDYGVQLRLSEDGSSFYLFAIGDNHKFAFFLWQNSEWNNLMGWEETSAIKPGKVNHLTVSAQGSHFNLFINDVFVGEIEDSQLSEGKVGLWAEIRHAGDHAIIEFDNFELRAPLDEAILSPQAADIPEPAKTTTLPPISPENVTEIVQIAALESGKVNAIAWSPTGESIAVASPEGIYLYNAETLKELWFLETNAWITSIAFSPDGHTLASGSSDTTVRLWSVEDQQPLIVLEGHTSPVYSLAFSPDGAILASGAGDHTVRLWEVESGELLRALEGHESSVNSVAFDPKEPTLASGSCDNTIRLWNVENGALLQKLDGHSMYVSSIAFSPDGHLLASGSWDDTVRLWDVDSGGLVYSLSGHTNNVSSIAFGQDGRLLASGSWDHTLQFWNIENGELLYSLEGIEATVRGVTFSPDGSKLASGHDDGSLLLWGIGFLQPPNESNITPTQLPSPTTSHTPLSPIPTSRPTATRTAIPTSLPDLIIDENGISMVLVPAGAFEMGGNADVALAECQKLFEPFAEDTCDRSWYENEEPIHTVMLNDFYIDHTEVTNAQYATCVAAGSCDPPSQLGSSTRSNYYGDSQYNDYPVIFVNWQAAQSYCEWRSARLPTEAEWERAARGGLEGKEYIWGDGFEGKGANFCDENCESDWANNEFDDGYKDTASVGNYEPNSYGLYDMAGNVFEWVADWYDSDYYRDAPSSNPQGPLSGVDRVIRSGAWSVTGSGLRVTRRHGIDPDGRYSDLGFRCARDVEQLVTTSFQPTQIPEPIFSSTATHTVTPSPTLSGTFIEISDEYGVPKVRIPAGTFQMGSDADDALAECEKLYIGGGCQRSRFTDEEPIHPVALDTYYIDQYEVTNAHYAACVDAGTCKRPSSTGSYTRSSYYGDSQYDDYPVIFVSWVDASAYCQWRGARLPTEAEWEKAARGGLEGQLYPWGDSFDVGRVNFCDRNCGFDWANHDYDDGYNDTAPVGSYAPNGYGLYDMAGNVWEWVADWYDEDYYDNSLFENPEGHDSGALRALRGGSWGDSGYILQVAIRKRLAPTVFTDLLGFRCALSH